MHATSWVGTQRGGPSEARAVTPEVAAKIIKNAEKPAIVIGARIKDVEGVLERVIRIANTKNMPIVATAHSSRFLEECGFKNYVKMGVVEITNAATDPEWKGINGAMPDLVIVLGVHLALMNATFQSLKNFSEIKTLALSRYFMANASFSFPNLTDELWLEYLERVCRGLEAERAR